MSGSFAGRMPRHGNLLAAKQDDVPRRTSLITFNMSRDLIAPPFPRGPARKSRGCQRYDGRN